MRSLAIALLMWSSICNAIPEILRKCETTKECILVIGNCLPDVAVNTKYVKDVREVSQQMEAAMNCMRVPPKESPVAACVNQLCEPPVGRAKEKCVALPKASPSSNAKLNDVIERLLLPMSLTQERAIRELAAFGPEAKVVIPILNALWNRSNDAPYDRTHECFFGYTDLREPILSLLKGIGPHASIPAVVLSTSKTKRKYAENPDSKKRSSIILVPSDQKRSRWEWSF